MAECYPDSDSVRSSVSDDEGSWLDEHEDNETVAVISLLADRVFPDALSMIAYCKEKGLDFVGIRDRLGLDFHGSVKLINFSEFTLFPPIILFHLAWSGPLVPFDWPFLGDLMAQSVRD